MIDDRSVSRFLMDSGVAGRDLCCYDTRTYFSELTTAMNLRYALEMINNSWYLECRTSYYLEYLSRLVCVAARGCHTLLVIIVALLTDHIEELQAVLSLACAHHPQPVTKLLLLEKLLRQVFQVASAEFLMCNDFDPAIAKVGHSDGIAKITGAAVDFDALLEEGCEC